MVSKRKLVGHINDVAAYAVANDCPYVLGWRRTSSSVLKQVTLVRQEAKSNACWYLKTMGECVDQALYARVVVEGIAVKVAEFRGVPLQGGALKGCGNVGFDKGRFFEGYQALETLDKEHYVPVINVLAHKYYLAFSMCFIEMRVKIAEIRLIPPFGAP